MNAHIFANFAAFGRKMDIVQALSIAALNEARLATRRRLDSAIQPGKTAASTGSRGWPTT
jgi:hypothetical protein